VTWQILTGDCIEQMRTLGDESVHCCVTSPPYWGLRDYGVDGQLGLEETPEQFITAMVDVFREVRRVLRSDGTLWLNIGDSFSSGGRSSQVVDSKAAGDQATAVRPSSIPGIKPKDLVGIPWMLAFALRADGWYLRRDIIWSKPNPMPESVTDRPTSAHEYLFLLTKSPRYFYDAEAIREKATYAGPNGAQRSPHAQGFGRRTPEEERERQDKQRGHGRRHAGFNDRWDAMSKEEQQALGRNKRSVWAIATKPFPDAHFATFPPDLVEPCIRAGTAPRVCGKCGAPWRRIVQASGGTIGEGWHPHLDDLTEGQQGGGRLRDWEPTCDHADDSGHALVLDPFCGAATTGLVATQLGRDFVGVELNPEYVALGEERIRHWEHDPAGHLKRQAVDEAQIGLELDPA